MKCIEINMQTDVLSRAVAVALPGLLESWHPKSESDLLSLANPFKLFGSSFVFVVTNVAAHFKRLVHP